MLNKFLKICIAICQHYLSGYCEGRERDKQLKKGCREITYAEIACIINHIDVRLCMCMCLYIKADV